MSQYPGTGQPIKTINMANIFSFLRWPLLGAVVLFLVVSMGTVRASDPPVSPGPELSIVRDNSPGMPVLHGLNKLTQALRSRGVSFEEVNSLESARGEVLLVAGLAYEGGPASRLLSSGGREVPRVAESLMIWKTLRDARPAWVVSGYDDRGLMYGLLDVADRIGWSTDPKSPMSEVKEITEQPEVKERAVSMYTMNRAEWEQKFYDESYWANYLDMLASDRFNTLTVIFGYENGGFLAPCYPYFFDVDGFPGVRMAGLTKEQQERNLFSLNRLVRMAHERGISFRVGIWDHIYRGGVQGGGIADA